ncbi:PepSY-associated TM helix domain-containing protein [Hymenobacter jeollabukensis]|uniref:PepSY domain-containing protein n=1 Tax=Hymenobacter jeollabukensis TaxID=2025313 RepID=A0A5R8WN45_9BACT|nr:PepSY-associated TM helix domain-containing protein [Hymenobacter jeollabukensis]TLM91000.1 PepSY domain-containing protein [Hymenobacter jeollabukensis]
MQTLDQTAPARRGTIRQSVQRHMYRWHRVIGLITVLPVICWTLSGLLHPLMSNWLRPKIAREALPPLPAPRPALPLTQVLRQHNLTQLRNVRLVRWRGQPAYQLLIDGPTARPRYFNATSGAALPADADRQYAEQLARYFAQDSTTGIRRAERLTRFDAEYKFVNRLLPVWKVTFERPDGLTVYVETMPARLATFNNATRAAFIRSFDALHSWSWVEWLSGSNTVRVLLMLALLTIIIGSAVSGLVIYGFMWGRFRRPRNAADKVGWLRKYHRAVGLAVALVTLTFASSGAFHVYLKLHPDERLRYQHAPILAADRLAVDLTQLPLDWARVQNVALAEFDGELYYQVFQLPAEDADHTNGKPTGASTGQPVEVVSAAPISYYRASTGQLLLEGAERHARFLATRFFQQAAGPYAATPAIEQTALVDHFEGEYGFINKRLPVVKVVLRTPSQTTLYVEPATGRLAARVDNLDRYEGLSFAFLHKYHAVGSLGKNIRDAITMLAAAGVLAVSLLGLWLFVKVKH